MCISKKLSIVFSLVFVLALHGMEQGHKGAQQESPLVDIILRHSTIRESITQCLPDNDLAHLAKTCHALHDLFNAKTESNPEPELAARQIKLAIWLSNVLNAQYVECHNRRVGPQSNASFQNYVLESIRVFAHNHPGTWIKLNLGGNELGNDLPFFNTLIQRIVQVTHSLGIDIAKLDLCANDIGTVPEHVFAALGNLQELDLDDNDLDDNEEETLPEHVFAALGNLQRLNLSSNQLRTLPANVFAGLGNLQRLELDGNYLETLPEHVFAGLGKLQKLYLGYNHLETPPEYVFAGLGNLLDLILCCNQIKTLPANVFAGLGNLNELHLFENQLTQETKVSLQLPPGVNVDW